jgi:hypothetical protein
MTVAALAQCAIIYRLAGRITRLPGREKGREPIHSPAPDSEGDHPLPSSLLRCWQPFPKWQETSLSFLPCRPLVDSSQKPPSVVRKETR